MTNSHRKACKAGYTDIDHTETDRTDIVHTEIEHTDMAKKEDNTVMDMVEAGAEASLARDSMLAHWPQQA